MAQQLYNKTLGGVWVYTPAGPVEVPGMTDPDDPTSGGSIAAESILQDDERNAHVLRWLKSRRLAPAEAAAPDSEETTGPASPSRAALERYTKTQLVRIYDYDGSESDPKSKIVDGILAAFAKRDSKTASKVATK